LQLLDLRKRFGATEALRGVSLEIEPGELVTLLGASGSGKTTTLRIVAGCLAPDDGTVMLDGRPAQARDIGTVFPDHALLPEMTAAENVRGPLERRGVTQPRLRDRVRHALAQVHLDGMADLHLQQLSSGQRLRLAIASAIATRPRALLLDEPLAALDRQLRDALQAEIMRIQRELSITVVHATHDQEEALVMSDRIAILRNGRIEQIGTGEDLYERPASVFVADLMGDSNIIRGVFRRVDGRAVLEAGSLCVGVKDACGNGPIADGDLAAVVVRPERMRLDGTAGPGINAIAGSVRDRVYVGAFTKYRVELHGGPLVTVTVTDAEPLAIGRAVQVTWNADRTVLLRDEPLRTHAAPEPAVAGRPTDR
jgi:putative spermidine/putrescine transport system ATP-binding protein